MSEPKEHEHIDASQFDNEPTSLYRDGKFWLIYPDGTEVEEKPKSKKQKALEAIDSLRKKED